MFRKRLISYFFILLLNVPALIALSTCFSSGYVFAGSCGSSTSSCINRSGQSCSCSCPGGASRNGTCGSANACNPSSACPPPSPTPGCIDDSSCPAGQFCYQLSNTRICYSLCDSSNTGTFCHGSYCQYGQCTQTGPHSCVCNTPSPSPSPPPNCNDGEKRCGVSMANYSNLIYGTVEQCQNGTWVSIDDCNATDYYGMSTETCRENPEPHCEPNNLNCGNQYSYEGCYRAPGGGFNSYDGMCSSNYETRSQSNGGTCCCPTPTPPIDCSNNPGDPNANPPVPRGGCASAPSGGSVLASGQTCPSGNNQWGNCCCPTPYPSPNCNGENICPPNPAPGANYICCFSTCCPTNQNICSADVACGSSSATPTSTPNSTPTPTSAPSATPDDVSCNINCSNSSCRVNGQNGTCQIVRTATFAGCQCVTSSSSNSIVAPSNIPELPSSADTYVPPASVDSYMPPSSTDTFDTMYP